MRAYQHIGYDAVAVSSRDLSAGSEFFLPTHGGIFQWISINVVDKDGNGLVAPYIVKQIGDLTITIVGLTGDAPATFDFADIIDWREPLRQVLSDLRNTSDMIVVLSNLSPLENEELSRDFNEIDIIITADPKRGNQPVTLLEGGLSTQAEGRGKYLGKIEITFHPKGLWQTHSGPSSAALKQKLAAVDWQLKKISQSSSTASSDPTQRTRRIKQIESNRSAILAQIHKKEIEEKGHSGQPSILNTFTATFLPIKPRSSDDSVDQIVEGIKASINAYSRDTSKRAPPNESANRTVLAIEDYSGVTSCAECHESQYTFWRNSAHAHAYNTLEKQGQEYNPDCLPCHVTGGRIDNTSSDEEKLLLLHLPETHHNVTCESCHGPAQRHVIAPETVTPLRVPLEEGCKRCHTFERDDDFVFVKKLHIAGCPKE